MPDRCKVYVVSVPGSRERRAKFTARAETTLDWTFFDAHTKLSPDLVYDERGALAHEGRTLRAGELGCYSSHYAVWGELLASGDRQCVVLEDDVIVDWRGVEAVAATDLAAAGIDYLRLYFKKPGRYRLVKRDFVRSRLNVVELFDLAFGTQGYLITRNAAQTFREKLKTVVHTVDHEMDRYFAHGVRNLSVFPFLLIEETVPSDIGDARFERHEKSREALKHLARDAAARRRAKLMMYAEKFFNRGNRA